MYDCNVATAIPKHLLTVRGAEVECHRTLRFHATPTGHQICKKREKAMKQTRISIVALLLFIAAICALPVSRANETKSPTRQITFNKDIAPIFFKSCAECHRPGEAAPFSALSYKDARPWAKSIREKVASRAMPPW